jgi:hypothetical protein
MPHDLPPLPDLNIPLLFLRRIEIEHEVVVGEVAAEPDDEAGKDGAPDFEPEAGEHRSARLAVLRQTLQREQEKGDDA